MLTASVAAARSFSRVLLGLLLLLVDNRAVSDAWTVFGGYSAGFTKRAASLDLVWYGRNLFGAMLDSRRGLFLYSPFLLILLPGLLAVWRTAPAWVRGSAVGDVIYFLVQYKLNRFADGSAALGYRYPMEGLIALAPRLFLSYMKSVRTHWIAVRLFVVAVTLSIAFQFVAAMDGFG